MKEASLRKLQEMKLHGMAEKLEELSKSPKYSSFSHDDLLALIIDYEYDRRRNNKIQRLLRTAKVKLGNACVEDIDYSTRRNLKKEQVQNILESRFIENGHNLLISGATGVGKTFLASAFANLACREGFSTLYYRTPRLLEYVKQEKLLGNYLKTIDKIGRVSVLVIDDLGPDVMTKEERNHFMEIVEERSLRATTIITSQLPLEQWYGVFEDQTVADAICDRLFHNAHKIQLKGESMRKK
jgi:DNA replication protein DnaC